MNKIKFSLVFLSLISYLALAHLARFFLRFAKKTTRLNKLNALTVWLCHILRVIGGVHIHIEGNKYLLKEKGLFFIANHIGYLDGIVMGSLIPGSFIAKIEILEMILIGKVVEVCETIFVDSRKKQDIVRYNKEMADRLKEMVNIIIFPEGHCTDGSRVLPFYAAYFDAPLQAQVGIVPISVEYEKLDGQPIKNREELCFFENMSFFPHLLNILKYKRIDIRVKIHEKIETKEYASNSKDRKFIANYTHGVLAKYKQSLFPTPEITEPVETEKPALLEV